MTNFELLQTAVKIMMVEQARLLNDKVKFMDFEFFEEQIKELNVFEINEIIMEISLWSRSRECVSYICELSDEKQSTRLNNLISPEKSKMS